MHLTECLLIGVLSLGCFNRLLCTCMLSFNANRFSSVRVREGDKELCSLTLLDVPPTCHVIIAATCKYLTSYGSTLLSGYSKGTDLRAATHVTSLQDL